VVDDSALMRRHLRELLEGEGDFTVRTARNGVEALETFDPDVITLDIKGPSLNNRIICRAVWDG
jgi:two-component system chemotaxis response regulator CheB